MIQYIILVVISLLIGRLLATIYFYFFNRLNQNKDGATVFLYYNRPTLLIGLPLLTGVIFLLLYLRFQWDGWGLFKIFFLFSLLILVFLIDLQFQIIPDCLIAIGLIVLALIQIFLSIRFQTSAYIVDFLFGFLAGALPIALIILITKGGMGGGDMKLFALIGACLGFFNVWIILILSILLGGLIATILMIFKKTAAKSKIVFGPFIVLSTFITVYFNNDILLFIAEYYHVSI